MPPYDERRSIIVDGEGMPGVRSIRCGKCNKWFRTNVTRRVCALCRVNPVYKQKDNPTYKKDAPELPVDRDVKNIPDASYEKRFKAFEKLWD